MNKKSDNIKPTQLRFSKRKCVSSIHNSSTVSVITTETFTWKKLAGVRAPEQQTDMKEMNLEPP